MRRPAIWLPCLTLALAACSGGTAADQPTTTPEGPAVNAPSTTATANATSSHAADATVAPPTTDSGRPVAPDFTLELGDGGEYTLSEGSKPVYLVFWAEW
ncbi:MAG: hypothetical protein KY394_01170 [Actinobacteria bacterium]|nr:hypothetical protein [Actinomycetota bacterium]